MINKPDNIPNYPQDEEISLLTPEISYILFHNVILMNVCSYVIRYEVKLEREALKRIEKVNNSIDLLQGKINLLKEEAQSIKEDCDMAA